MRDVGIIVDCSDQCRPASSFQYGLCIDLFNTLGIEQCNLESCSSVVYNLSGCITEETGITTTSQNAVCQCSSDREAVPNDITMGQSQVGTSTVIYRTETINKTEAQNVSCTTKPLSSTEAQCHRIIGALAGLVVVLLVMAIRPWIWICWRLNANGGLERDKQQAR